MRDVSMDDTMSSNLLIKTMTKTNKPSIGRLTILNVVMNVEKPRSLLNKVHRNSTRKMMRTDRALKRKLPF